MGSGSPPAERHGTRIALRACGLCALGALALACGEYPVPGDSEPDAGAQDASLSASDDSAWEAQCLSDASAAHASNSAPNEDAEGEAMGELLAPALGWGPASDEDPFAEYRPSDLHCSTLLGWYIEDNELEVNTAECNYVTLTQPARALATPGMRLHARLIHFDLTAPAPAVGRFILQVGSNFSFEYQVDIPSEAKVVNIDESIDTLICPGTPAYLHISNHGQNTWRLSDVRVAP